MRVLRFFFGFTAFATTPSKTLLFLILLAVAHRTLSRLFAVNALYELLTYLYFRSNLLQMELVANAPLLVVVILRYFLSDFILRFS